VRFPDSRYTPDALLRMGYIVQSLAKYEVHVAKYYYKRGAYVAAINRAQTAVTDYRNVPAVEEALFVIYKSYDALGMESLRDDAKRVLEATYPDSKFLVSGGTGESGGWLKLF
jgi:outer membrane protein assembly factor BamD